MKLTNKRIKFRKLVNTATTIIITKNLSLGLVTAAQSTWKY